MYLLRTHPEHVPFFLPWVTEWTLDWRITPISHSYWTQTECRSRRGSKVNGTEPAMFNTRYPRSISTIPRLHFDSEPKASVFIVREPSLSCDDLPGGVIHLDHLIRVPERIHEPSARRAIKFIGLCGAIHRHYLDPLPRGPVGYLTAGPRGMGQEQKENRGKPH